MSREAGGGAGEEEGKKRREERSGWGEREGAECQRLLEASTIIDTLRSGTCSTTAALRSLCRSCQPGGPRSTRGGAPPPRPSTPGQTNERTRLCWTGALVMQPHVCPSSVHSSSPLVSLLTGCVWRLAWRAEDQPRR